MKKILSYIIAIMMVATMMPYTALAADSAEKETISVSHSYVNPVYNNAGVKLHIGDVKVSTKKAKSATYLSTYEQAAQVIKNNLKNRKTSFTINYKMLYEDYYGDAWFDDFCEKTFAIAFKHTGKPTEGDYIFYCFGGYEVEAEGSVDEKYIYWQIPFQAEFYTTAAQENELDTAISSLMSELALDGKSDYEKVKIIYDYMTANIEYDYDNLNDDSYLLKYTAYAALIDKTAVCQGYAGLFYRLALEAGVDTRVISGYSMGEAHAWNIVKLGDKYYYLDATWDSGCDEYGYFLKGSTEFNEDHTADYEFRTEAFKEDYPISEDDYNFEEPEQPAEPENPGEPEEPGVDDPNPGECTHEFGEWIEEDEGGKCEGWSRYHVCVICEYCEREEMPATGHDLDKHAANDPTCIENGNIEYYTCNNCGKLYADAEGKKEITKPDTIIGAEAHIFTEVTVAPTCTEAGQTKLVCIGCGKTIVTKTTLPTGHIPDGNPIIEPTCEKDGLIVTVKCTVCGETIKEEEVIPARGHDFVDVGLDKKATCKEAGYDHSICSHCDKEIRKTIPATGHKYSAFVTTAKATFGKAGVQTSTCAGCKATVRRAIPAVATPVLSAKAYTFNNKAKTPTVKIAGLSGGNYTIAYAKGRKTVGTYKVTVTLKGANYYGSKILSFKINPKGVEKVKLTKGKKQIKVSWKKPLKAYRNQIDGYQIRYATSKSKLAKATPKKFSGKTLTSKTVKKLKTKKKYYVQIRTYNKVGKTTYYSGWSTAKSVKTK